MCCKRGLRDLTAVPVSKKCYQQLGQEQNRTRTGNKKKILLCIFSLCLNLFLGHDQSLVFIGMQNGLLVIRSAL